MTTFIFLFIVIWWLTIFWVLPFGNAPEEKPQKGNAASAPANPRLWQKVIINTIIALIITALATWFIESGQFDAWVGKLERYE